MNVKIKRFDLSLPLPVYQSAGAVAVDLYARTETTIAPGKIDYIPLNIAIELPQGYWALIAARSSTHKLGIMPANNIGIVDTDFNGDTDEIVLASYNFTENTVTIEKGKRIAQLMIFRHEPITFQEVTKLGNKNRGKFGSTGL